MIQITRRAARGYVSHGINFDYISLVPYVPWRTALLKSSAGKCDLHIKLVFTVILNPLARRSARTRKENKESLFQSLSTLIVNGRQQFSKCFGPKKKESQFKC
jgi:hypothetical protein